MGVLVRILIFFYLFLAATSAHALVCTHKKNVDLRDGFCEKVRDQDSIGWCGSYAISGIFSYHLNLANGKVDCENRVSAVHLGALAIQHGPNSKRNLSHQRAILKALRDGKTPVKGIASYGFSPFGLLELGLKHGLCSEAIISSQDYDFSRLASGGGQAQKLNELFREIHAAKISNNNACEVQTQLEMLYPHAEFDDLKQVFAQADAENLILKLNEMACPKTLKNIGPMTFDSTIPYSEGQWLFKGSDRKSNEVLSQRPDFMGMVDGELDNKRPVVISIEKSLLIGAPEKSQKKDIPHSLIVTGRVWNCEKGEWEYMLRNSWGGGCESLRGEDTPEVVAGTQDCYKTVATQSEIDKSDDWINNVYPKLMRGWREALARGEAAAADNIAKIKALFNHHSKIFFGNRRPIKSEFERKVEHQRCHDRARLELPLRNPNIRCEEESGTIFVGSKLLDKHVLSITRVRGKQ